MDAVYIASEGCRCQVIVWLFSESDCLKSIGDEAILSSLIRIREEKKPLSNIEDIVLSLFRYTGAINQHEKTANHLSRQVVQIGEEGALCSSKDKLPMVTFETVSAKSNRYHTAVGHYDSWLFFYTPQN